MYIHTTLISSTNRTSTSTKVRNSQITDHRQTCLVTTETSSVCHRSCRAMAWVSTAGPKPQLPIAPINLSYSLLTPQIERLLSKYSGKILATLTQFCSFPDTLATKDDKRTSEAGFWVEAEVLIVQYTSSTQEILVYGRSKAVNNRNQKEKGGPHFLFKEINRHHMRPIPPHF